MRVPAVPARVWLIRAACVIAADAVVFGVLGEVLDGNVAALIADWLIVATLLGIGSFLVAYSALAAWWESAPGRAVVAVMLAMGGYFALFVATKLHSDTFGVDTGAFTGQQGWRLVVYSLAPVAAGHLAWVILREQTREIRAWNRTRRAPLTDAGRTG